MNPRDWLAEELYRVPRGGRGARVALGFGLLVATLALLGLVVGTGLPGPLRLPPAYLALGSAFVAMGAAELQPAGRVRTAAVLRLAAVAAFLGFGSSVVLPAVLDRGPGATVGAVGFLLAVGVCVWVFERTQRRHR